ncbi:Protein GrpE [Koleobacter methoxysyntrophicus]|jgi:molecular chaperone GrpE|uniref:Protein GrpE n=1 Tax=Koleobacter methoxysyntrophicus TaxID=2751313 RepID=A0A8A0RS97_9FIRM|nr:nucleotide exchange factor GrpE [Koleobacter methoxysyntrophicus]MDK2901196.1 molecular chaperone GrpE [Thermosediminibacterales bacterium]QSQ10227.1 Protein GrpE [Koleobacter methoxysyntrophicus]
MVNEKRKEDECVNKEGKKEIDPKKEKAVEKDNIDVPVEDIKDGITPRDGENQDQKGLSEEKQQDDNEGQERPEEDINKIKKALEEKTKEAQDYFNMLQRLQADFENYKKRIKRDRQDMVNYAAEEIVKQLLPVIDNLERALDSAGEKGDVNPSFVEGIEMILKQIKGLLESQGVKEIEALGKKFDPQYHEAVMKIEDDTHGENTVVEVLQKGYIMNSKVIRPSLVKVSK